MSRRTRRSEDVEIKATGGTSSRIFKNIGLESVSKRKKSQKKKEESVDVKQQESDVDEETTQQNVHLPTKIIKRKLESKIESESDDEPNTQITLEKKQKLEVKTPPKRVFFAAKRTSPSPSKPNPKSSEQSSSSLSSSSESQEEKQQTKKPLTWPFTELFQMAQRTLLIASIPDEIFGRSKEKEEIRTWWQSHLKQQRPGSLYISGSPGTGKTALMNELMNEMSAWESKQQLPRVRTIHVNCMQFTEAKQVFSYIATELCVPTDDDESLGSSADAFAQRVAKHFSKIAKKEMVVIILDEMDQLKTTKKSQDILYRIFEWVAIPNSPLILIGIANSLDMTETSLPLLKSANCQPKLMHFMGYNKDQILGILQQRLNTLPVPLFEPPALMFVASKVASHSGDIRRALDICRQAIETVEDSTAKQPCETIKPISIAQANKIVNSILGSPTVLAIRNLPTHHKVILVAAVLAFRKNKKVDYRALKQQYQTIYKMFSVSPVTDSDFKDVCDHLTSVDLIQLGPQKDISLKHITLKVAEEDVIFGLKDQRLFANMLQ